MQEQGVEFRLGMGKHLVAVVRGQKRELRRHAGGDRNDVERGSIRAGLRDGHRKCLFPRTFLSNING